MTPAPATEPPEADFAATARSLRWQIRHHLAAGTLRTVLVLAQALLNVERELGAIAEA
ncbi:MAG: hypothetical protein IT377_27820 [Polyangiaceae bacterium]|nr:hypothetical protein [Polyangiaceae bacterium]